MVGRAHGINASNSYVFTDTIRYTDVGVYRYSVTIQFFDMSLSSVVNTNEVVI